MTIPYELGEMKAQTGEVLRYEVEVVASGLAIQIEKQLHAYPIYLEILERVKSPRTPLYFERVIKSEIYGAARDLCVLRWHHRNGVPVDRENDSVSATATGVFPLLEKVWPDSVIALTLTNDISLKQHSGSIYRSTRAIAKRVRNGYQALYSRWQYAQDLKKFADEKGCIAVQYIEGIDLHRRSEIIWYPDSGIPPDRILIYFASPDHDPVDKRITQAIETMGMKWVCLNMSSTTFKGAPAWYPPFNCEKAADDLLWNPKSDIERWIYQRGKELIEEINYWSAFYRAFNVKIHFIIGGSDSKYIAQGIAFDMNNSKNGFVVGKERSELHWPPICILGWYPVDIFFTWTSRAKKYLEKPNVNRTIASVVTGYTNDAAFEGKREAAKQLKAEFRTSGVDYVVALFDNVHGPDIAHSTANMERFYLVFLQWLLQDPAVGILIKSKKPSVLQRLPGVRPVLERAEATGRCIRLADEFGRLPVDASLASDISVGIGISSALIESAIAGCRGVHCDLTHFRSHEFYQWGYEKIIFDDIDRLISAMKSHKAGNAAYEEIGDWTPFLDKLDPYRDGRAGERMGTYLRWCLEGFDAGLDRDNVIRQSNAKFNVRWGLDKATMLAIS
jgi:hypothetical protein